MPLEAGRRPVEVIESERREEIRRSARDLLLVERARGWLLGDEAG
jgi:hypothetical protein